ncbi:MAG: imidazolonepropionase [Gammaproteobacteria bacterium]|nr:imidazolonepropionase [Gammaproteobacteria bacterium]NNM14073.1 imidazolonepropionase [Gammaproteobacteria bacterium]
MTFLFTWINRPVKQHSDQQSVHDLVIHNARLYPMSGNIECSECDQIAIDNGLISSISKSQSEGVLAARTSIDAQQRVLLPSFIDCHTHIVYAGDRSAEHNQRLRGVDYAEIHASGGGIYATVNAVRKADEAELIQQSMQRIQALQSEGVTTLEIKSGYGLDTDNELKMLGAIRTLKQNLPMNIVSTFLGAHTIPKNTTQNEYLDLIISEMLPLIAKHDLADAVDMYVENIAFDNAAMTQLFKAAQDLKLNTRVHAEQLSHMRAAETAASLGALSADHLEYLDKGGARVMGEHGCVAVLLPNAFYFLQETRKPPVASLRKHKVSIAVASDTNPGTSPIPSLLTALHFSVHLFGLDCQEALLGISLNAAKALGLQQKLGSLEVGKQADLALWDIPGPEFLCYQLGGLGPDQVWHKGVMCR